MRREREREARGLLRIFVELRLSGGRQGVIEKAARNLGFR